MNRIFENLTTWFDDDEEKKNNNKQTNMKNNCCLYFLFPAAHVKISCKTENPSVRGLREVKNPRQRKAVVMVKYVMAKICAKYQDVKVNESLLTSIFAAVFKGLPSILAAMDRKVFSSFNIWRHIKCLLYLFLSIFGGILNVYCIFFFQFLEAY